MRKKIIKKAAAVVMSAAMVTTALAGCGSKSSETGGSASSGNGEDDVLVLDVFDSQANFQGTQPGWFGKYVKDKFNIELNIIAPNVAGGGDTLFQTRSANGDLGDIIITQLDGNRLKDLVAAELVLDMTPYMDNCPNLSRYMTAIEEASRLAEVDGIWAVPSEVSELSATTPCDALEPTVAPSLRWDVYGAVGYPQMKNTDDLLDTLEKMQASARETEGSDDIYALSLFKDWDGEVMQNTDGIKGLYGYQQIGFCMAKVDGTDIQSVIDDDGIYVKALKFFFDANQRGLVDPESTTQEFGTVQTKFKNGKVLYSLWPWLGAGQYNTVEHTAEGKGFATAVIDDMQCLEYGCMPYGKMALGIMIGSKTKQPERVAEFVDWLYSPEGVRLQGIVQNYACGPEGLTWELQDGKPVFTDFGVEAFVENKKDLNIPDEWGGGSWIDGQSWLNYKSVGLVENDPETGVCYNYLKWEDYAEKTATELSKDWSQHYDGALNTIDLLSKENKMLVLAGTNYAVPEASTDITTIKEQCKQIIVEYSWKMAFAQDEAEFASLFEEMKTTVLGLGYEQVLAVDRQNCEDQYAAFEAAKAASK